VSYSLHLWLRDLLAELQVPGSSQNARALVAQAQAEGGNAHWNPLNTTVKYGACWPYNTFGDGFHVWNYANRLDGIKATAQTFRQTNFSHLLSQLQRGDSATRFWEVLVTPPPGKAKWGTTPPGLSIADWLASVDRHWYDYALRPIAGS